MTDRNEKPTAFGKAPPRVLVVEGDPAHRQAMVRMLDTIGCNVIVAENAEAARNVCARGPSFHVAIVDPSLPDGDGRALIAELRGMLGDRASRFLIVSAEACDAAAAGVDAALRKPVAANELLRLVHRLARSSSAATAGV